MKEINFTENKRYHRSKNSGVLVNSDTFKQRLNQLIPKAKDKVYIQAMTFEGDEVGKWLMNLLLQCPAKDIRLCVDSYSKFVINDHFVPGTKFLFDKTFRDEVLQTNKLLKLARKNGIKVTITNPLGFLFLKYPFRNHKKIVVIDDVSFVGGINFSEHNFEWHDMMLELHDSDLSNLLQEDIRSTGMRINQDMKFMMNNFDLYFLDGWNSRKKYAEIFSTLSHAKKSIHIFSPYISDPLLSFIKTNIPSQIDLNIISPQQNNKSLFKSLLMNEASYGYFKLWFFQNHMSHLKAILIDDKTLICGSSNFDFVSYYFEQEVVLVTTDEQTVSEFVSKIKDPDMRNSILANPSYITKNYFAHFFYQIIKISCMILAFANAFCISILVTKSKVK